MEEINSDRKKHHRNQHKFWSNSIDCSGRSMCWNAKSLALKLSAETRSSSAWFRKSAVSYFLGRSQIFHMVFFCLKSDPLWLAQLDLKPIFTHLHCPYLAIRHSNFWFILVPGSFSPGWDIFFPVVLLTKKCSLRHLCHQKDIYIYIIYIPISPAMCLKKMVSY